MSTPTQPFSQVNADERAGLAAARAEEGVERPGGSEAPQAGLAFSGGGIRSATFNLGVLQALASSRWLREIDYLSTVSGGGYLGGWLSALKRRAGNAGMEQTLRDHQGRQPAIQFLRDYSNYLTPRPDCSAWTPCPPSSPTGATSSSTRSCCKACCWRCC